MPKSEQVAEALLRFRVDNDFGSVDEKQRAKVAEKAVKLLLRHYGSMPAWIKELELILESKNGRSKCFSLPLGAFESPVTPLTFLQIWRWPNVCASDLLAEPHCRYKISRVLNANASANEEVCINPYHYKLASIEQPLMKVIAPVGGINSSGIVSDDRSAMELNGSLSAALETYSSAAPINVELTSTRSPEFCSNSVNLSNLSLNNSFPLSSNTQQVSAGGFATEMTNFTAYSNHASVSGAYGNSPLPNTRYTSGSSLQSAYRSDITPTGTPTYVPDCLPFSGSACNVPQLTIDGLTRLDNGATQYGMQLSRPGQFSKSPQPTATISYTGPLQQNEYNNGYVSRNAPSQTGLFGSFSQPGAAGLNNGVAYGEVEYVEPTCWCSVQYYEYLGHLGETFHCGRPTLTIDGFCDPNAPECFCLGRISNPNRELEADHVRRQIQRGVKLYYVAGEVYMENLSENAVFVQSSNMNMRNNWPLCAVCKVGAGMTAQLFSNRDFASLLAHNIKEGYESVFKLTYMCVIRMSFVKGWGAKYRRQTLSSVPCWVEIRLNGALQWLDRVLRQMGSPGLQTSTGSLK